jgi:hypothetical protein
MDAMRCMTGNSQALCVLACVVTVNNGLLDLSQALCVLACVVAGHRLLASLRASLLALLLTP